MAINPNLGGIQGTPDFQQLRESRQARLDAKVADATLSPSQSLSAREVQAHQAFYNSSVGHLDALRGQGAVGGALGAIGGLGSGDMQKFFPDLDFVRVSLATQPGVSDNQAAAEVKKGYSTAYAEAGRERTSASRTAEKLGPGEHTLSNGDKVTVKTDPKTGETTVSTTRTDGSTKEVKYSDKNPESVDVNRTLPNGEKETLHQDGTTVSKGSHNILGDGPKTTWTLDSQGRPSSEKSGPGPDDNTRVTANQDGSTDTRKLIYHENGQPVYENTHQPQDLPPFMRPDPNPPFPRPHPEPLPTPSPFPTPGPHPGPFPFPTPEPMPQPGPSPFPFPDPMPQPGPFPFPQPHPLPEPQPSPFPFPIPHPEPQPSPFPIPFPLPEPGPIHPWRPFPELPRPWDQDGFRPYQAL